MESLNGQRSEPVGDLAGADGEDAARLGDLAGGGGRDRETGVPTGSTVSGFRAFDLFMLVGESGVTSTRKGEVLPVTRRFRELLA
jgi:hypothetical protein